MVGQLTGMRNVTGQLNDWNAVMKGYVFFREDGLKKQGGGVILYVREQLECIKLQLGRVSWFYEFGYLYSTS